MRIQNRFMPSSVNGNAFHYPFPIFWIKLLFFSCTQPSFFYSLLGNKITSGPLGSLFELFLILLSSTLQNGHSTLQRFPKGYYTFSSRSPTRASVHLPRKNSNFFSISLIFFSSFTFFSLSFNSTMSLAATLFSQAENRPFSSLISFTMLSGLKPRS